MRIRGFLRSNDIHVALTEIFPQLKHGVVVVVVVVLLIVVHVLHALEHDAMVINLDANVIFILAGKYPDITLLKCRWLCQKALVGQSAKTFADPFG